MIGGSTPPLLVVQQGASVVGGRPVFISLIIIRVIPVLLKHTEEITAAVVPRYHTRQMASLFDNTTLSEEGIRSLLHLRGGLPTEHRFIAWKFLLHLPSNSKQFAELISRGPHPAALASLSVRYPLRDQKLFRKTAVLISALAHWSPILGDVEFVPSWVCPFVIVFSQVGASIFTYIRCERAVAHNSSNNSNTSTAVVNQQHDSNRRHIQLTVYAAMACSL